MLLALIATPTLRRIDRLLAGGGLFLGWRVEIARELWLRDAADTMARDALEAEWPW